MNAAEALAETLWSAARPDHLSLPTARRIAAAIARGEITGVTLTADREESLAEAICRATHPDRWTTAVRPEWPCQCCQDVAGSGVVTLAADREPDERRAADLIAGEVWAWLNRHDAPWSPSDAKVSDLAYRVAQALADDREPDARSMAEPDGLRAAVELTHEERLALAERIRIAFDTPPEERVIQDTWLYAAAMAEQWYVDRAPHPAADQPEVDRG